MDCSHPFTHLRSIDVPGQTWCEFCRSIVKCCHPFYRLDYTGGQETWCKCEACGCDLPQNHEIVKEIGQTIILPLPSRLMH